MEDNDSLFVTSSSSEPIKIKTEPGLEDQPMTVPAPASEETSSLSQPASGPSSNTKSTPTPSNTKPAKSDVLLRPQSIAHKNKNKHLQSTSETLNALYESTSAIALDSTPELVLNDENDDEIVLEYPVYYSTEYLEKLYLLQYPTRSAGRQLTDRKGTGIANSRIKPKSQVIEVDVPIETTQFYDNEKGEHWGGLNQQTFGGVAKPVEGYMIGVFKDKELHLNPVHATAQLRPQFQYISQPPAPIGDAAMASTVIDKEKEAANTPKSGPKAVHLSAKIVGDNAPSFSGALTARKKMEDEEFVVMDWYDLDTAESWDASDKLVSEFKTPLIPTTTTDKYLENISSPHVDPFEASLLAAKAAMAAKKLQMEAAAKKKQLEMASKASAAKAATARVPVRRAAKKQA